VTSKSGTIGHIGVLPQLLQNMLNISAIYADTNSQTFSLFQENGVDCLWCDLTAQILHFTSEDAIGYGSRVKEQSVTINDSSVECRIKIQHQR
jgi:hypothetical protein